MSSLTNLSLVEEDSFYSLKSPIVFWGNNNLTHIIKCMMRLCDNSISCAFSVSSFSRFK